MKPETGKFYESKHARFNEKMVYRDKFDKNWEPVNDSINKDNYFVLDNMKNLETEETSKMEGALPEISIEPKRKRGRPRKNTLINDTSFKNMTDKNNNTSEVYFTMKKIKQLLLQKQDLLMNFFTPC